MDGSPPVTAPPPAESVGTFSLRTLLLAVTLISVWVAVTTHLPWLGVILATVGVPAIFRALAIGRLERSQQSTWGHVDWVAGFIGSLIRMWVFTVISGLAFGIGLFVGAGLSALLGADGNLAVALMLVCGSGLGLTMLTCLIYATWPRAIRRSRAS